MYVVYVLGLSPTWICCLSFMEQRGAAAPSKLPKMLPLACAFDDDGSAQIPYVPIYIVGRFLNTFFHLTHFGRPHAPRVRYILHTK